MRIFTTRDIKFRTILVRKTFSWRVWVHHSPSARAANSHSREKVLSHTYRNVLFFSLSRNPSRSQSEKIIVNVKISNKANKIVLYNTSEVRPCKRATPCHFLRLPLSQKWGCSCVKAIVRQRYYNERSSCPKFLSMFHSNTS